MSTTARTRVTTDIVICHLSPSRFGDKLHVAGIPSYTNEPPALCAAAVIGVAAVNVKVKAVKSIPVTVSRHAFTLMP